MTTDNISPTESPEEFAAQWGCDPTYDHPPRHKGDGYLLYNFSVDGNDPAFLAKFIPAIERTIEAHRLQLDPKLYKPNPIRRKQIEQEIAELEELLDVVEGRLFAKTNLRPETCQFVPATAIFKDLPRAWALFVAGEHSDCSWGNNNRTLVTAETIIEPLEEMSPEEGDQAAQVEQAVQRLRTIVDGVYIDLEN